MSAQIESILSEMPDDDFSRVRDHAVKSDAEAANGRLGANDDLVHSPASCSGSRDVDILSEDSFPSLGAPSALKTNASWGAGKTAQHSQPSKTHTNPQAVPHKAKHNISIAHLLLESTQQQPRKEFGTKNGISDIIRQTMLTNQTQIDVSTSRSGAITFIIKGNPENVQRSRRYIMKELALRQSLAVHIPKSVLPHIIGAKGKTLKGIEERAAVKIQTPKRDENATSPLSEPSNEFDEIAEEPSVDITVEGDFEGVAIAKAEIDAIVNDKTSQTSVKFTTVAPEFYNLIAGPHHANVQKWEKNWDLKIHVPVSTMVEDGHIPAPITISGDKDQVKQARETIENLYSDLKATTIAAEIHVPKPQHKFIVGEKGNTIQEILAETDCSVIVPPANSLTDKIVVRGPPAKVGMGISMVMEKANSVSLTTLDILPAHKSRTDNPARHSRDLTRYFLRTKEFHRLETEHQVSIHFPRIADLEDENIKDCVWEISGKVKQNVDKVRVILRDLVKDYPPHRFAYIEIDSLLHRHIVGRNGRNLQKVNKENSVEIMLATEDESDSEVCIVYVGNPGEQLPSVADITRVLDNVKEQLQKITSEAANLVTQRYTVPVKYHKSIIGPNGTTLNTFTGGSESRVRVTFGNQRNNKRNRKILDDCDDETITVHGPSEEVERVIKEMRKYVEELKHHDVMHSYTDVFEFPQKYSKNLIGKGGANITKYREELGVSINVNEGKIEIKGIKKNVEEARSRIELLVERLKDETVKRLKVPIEHHSALIGKNGHLVKRLEDKYAVRINFPRTGEDLGDGTDRPSAADEVVIKGSKKGVLSAEDELRDLLNYEAEHGHSTEITVPSKAISRIVGKGGNTINDLKLETTTRIDIERAKDKGDTGTTIIQIYGTKTGVAKAKAAILEVSKEIEREVEETMHIDSQYHRNLIGPGGSTVRNILIEAGAEGDPSMLTRMVRFPRPGTGSDAVELRGDKIVIEKVMKEFNRIVNDLKSRITETISVPADQVSLIIGRAGSVRRDLETKYRVQLDISRMSKDTSSQDGIVKITGMDDAVAKAKEAIINIIKKQNVHCIMIPEQFHRTLADTGSTIRKLRSDFKVTVDHAGHTLPAMSEHLKPRVNGTAARIDDGNETDESSYPWDVVELEEKPAGQDIPWNLRGEKTNIDKATVFLSKLLEQAQKQTHIGYLSIPTIKHRYIIGPGGARINSIRAETGCTIDVPKRIGDDVVVIRGSKDGIEGARALIVKATATPSGASTPRNGSDHGRGRRR